MVDEDTSPVNVKLTGISFGVDCQEEDITVSVENTNSELITSVTLNYTSNNSTGSLDLTIAPEMSGESEITVTVEDGYGETVSENFKVKVKNVNDSPFLVNPIPDQMVNASYPLNLKLSAAPGDIFDDVDDGIKDFDIIMEDGSNLPEWITVLVNGTDYSLDFAPLIADTGCINIVVQAFDFEGGMAVDTFEICVEGYPVGINRISADKFEVKLYPNPTRGHVNVDSETSTAHDIDLTVVDITGQQVLRKHFSPTERITFDLSDKVSGMYFVKLDFGDVLITRKLIVDRK